MRDDLGSSSDESNMEMGFTEKMKVNRLKMYSRDLRSFCVELSGKCCQFGIGWVSSVTIRLSYGCSLIGKTTIKDMPAIPDNDNNLTFLPDEIHENLVKIRNMVLFESFFHDLMPKKDADSGPENTKMTAAALNVSPRGNRLVISIDMANMPRIKCSVRDLSISGNKITITLQLTNTSPIQLFFYRASDFVLRKDHEIVGNLSGMFDIDSGDYSCTLSGTIQDGVSGMVTLQGSRFNDLDNTWKQYVIRLFETEIDLDMGDEV